MSQGSLTPASEPTPVGPIRVGVVTSISGEMAPFGQASLQGYDLALQDINASGGIHGRPLKLVFEDDESKPPAAATAVEKLATTDQVPLVIGAYSSSATLLAAGMAERYAIPLIIPIAAADEITRQGYRWIFRLNAPSSVFTQTLFDFMELSERSAGESKIDHPTRMAIVFENTAFGTSIAEAADQQARARRMSVVTYQAYRADARDFSALLKQVQAAQPDVILFVSYLDSAIALMKQSQALDLNPSIFVAAGAGFSLPDFPRLAGSAAEYTISITHWTPDVKWQGAAEFSRRFQDKYGYLPQYHSAQTYAALQVAADALRRANSLDRKNIRAALESTDMNTISGPIHFDKNGQNHHTMLITQIIDGQFVTVYPADVAARAPIYPIPAWRQRPSAATTSGKLP
ncbi:MAG: ABC transporter substrate-binding protein [Chloroflexi bacterium]|nr:ABC transporter substrate-binding protein [Chloroflexota bacterium]